MHLMLSVNFSTNIFCSNAERPDHVTSTAIQSPSTENNAHQGTGSCSCLGLKSTLSLNLETLYNAKIVVYPRKFYFNTKIRVGSSGQNIKLVTTVYIHEIMAQGKTKSYLRLCDHHNSLWHKIKSRRL